MSDVGFQVEAKFGKWSPGIPVLTWCFQHAVLAEIPPLFLLLMLPLLCVQLRRAERETRLLRTRLSGLANGPGVLTRKSSGRLGTPVAPLPFDTIANMKYLLTSLMLSDKLFVVIRSCYEMWGDGEQVPIVEFVYPMAQSATLVSKVGVVDSTN